MYHLFHSKNATKRPALDLLVHLGADDLANGFYYDYNGLKVLVAEGPMDFIIGGDEPLG